MKRPTTSASARSQRTTVAPSVADAYAVGTFQRIGPPDADSSVLFDLGNTLGRFVEIRRGYYRVAANVVRRI